MSQSKRTLSEGTAVNGAIATGGGGPTKRSKFEIELEEWHKQEDVALVKKDKENLKRPDLKLELLNGIN